MPEKGTVHHAHLQFNLYETIDVLSFFDVPFILRGNASKKLARKVGLLHELMADNKNENLQKTIYAQSLGYSILSCIISESKQKNVAIDFNSRIKSLKPVFDYIEQNLSAKITRSDLAEKAAYSESRFHVYFKEIMKISPMVYLKNIRMKKAAQLLLSEDKNVAETGALVGYPDIYHFSRVFKEVFAISPSQYKKKHKSWLENISSF